ncbi:MAG: transcription termination/antitermination NusG family protein, partial [Spirulina sp.]
MNVTRDDLEDTNEDFQTEEESFVPTKNARWYAVQVASGCEKRVKTNLEQRIHTLD